MKKIVSLFVCFVICFSLFSFTAFAEKNGDWVYKHENIKWQFHASTGTLTVSGNGRMHDYGNIITGGLIEESIACNNTEIKHIVIEEGITYIGEYSFEYCKNTETVSLPDSLREIGDYAFAESCGNLTSIAIPAGVRRIGSNAFTSFNMKIDKLNEIKFYGNPPVIEENGLFTNFKGVVFYPCFDSWTEEVMQNYENSSQTDIVWKEWSAPVLDDIEEIFLDLEYGSWYIPAVEAVYTAKVMKGTEKGFDPNLKLTREQAIQILYNMKPRNDSLYNGDTGFIDVPQEHWAARAVKWAKENDISNGIGQDRFGLGQLLSREQFATLLANYTQTEGFDTSKGKDISTFEDHKNVSDWAKKGIEYCVEIGVIKGTEKNTLNPKGEASRTEIAQMISNYLNFRNSVVKIVFNANEGECNESIRFIIKGEAVGELPVPVREGCEFNGWIYNAHFTATADSIFKADIELLATWK